MKEPALSYAPAIDAWPLTAFPETDHRTSSQQHAVGPASRCTDPAVRGDGIDPLNQPDFDPELSRCIRRFTLNGRAESDREQQ